MEWAWLAFGLVAGFAVLSLLGSERQRRIDQLPKPAATIEEPADST